MGVLGSVLSGGHPIDFLPVWGAQLIRVILLCLSAFIWGRIVFGMLTVPALKHLPWTRKLAWLGVSLFILRSTLFQIFNFDGKLPWETLVLVLPATVCVAIALYDVIRRHDRASSGYQPF